jgi:anti-sigma-K factor RskA/sigma-70-like protein
MSGLETLPPDQRAVLQLILRQGRGYADLAGLLKIDVGAVRERAQAGIEALGADGAAGLAPDQRARIADYLLGQQDDAERIVTLAELAESADAARWARRLHARIAPLASGPLPEVPAAASPNGAPPVSRPSAGRPRPRPSRLGGAILLASLAALIAVLVVVLVSGGDDGNGSKTSAAATTSAPATSARTQPPTSTTPAPAIIGQANLQPTPSGGKAIGLGLVQRSGRKLTLALQAQRLPANGAQDIYGVWLQGSSGSKFLGYVPQQVRANGTVTVSAPLPGNLRSYATVLLAHEPTSGAPPTQPGLAVLSGPLKLAS